MHIQYDLNMILVYRYRVKSLTGLLNKHAGAVNFVWNYCLPPERPKGIAELGVRHWVCSGCSCEHDRDVNAALNILARHGHVPPVVGISVL
jgi:hypothetical protein